MAGARPRACSLPPSRLWDYIPAFDNRNAHEWLSISGFDGIIVSDIDVAPLPGYDSAVPCIRHWQITILFLSQPLRMINSGCSTHSLGTTLLRCQAIRESDGVDTRSLRHLHRNEAAEMIHMRSQHLTSGTPREYSPFPAPLATLTEMSGQNPILSPVSVHRCRTNGSTASRLDSLQH